MVPLVVSIATKRIVLCRELYIIAVCSYLHGAISLRLDSPCAGLCSGCGNIEACICSLLKQISVFIIFDKITTISSFKRERIAIVVKRDGFATDIYI